MNRYDCTLADPKHHIAENLQTTWKIWSKESTYLGEQQSTNATATENYLELKPSGFYSMSRNYVKVYIGRTGYPKKQNRRNMSVIYLYIKADRSAVAEHSIAVDDQVEFQDTQIQARISC
jgi:hypothetical protein